MSNTYNIELYLIKMLKIKSVQYAIIYGYLKSRTLNNRKEPIRNVISDTAANDEIALIHVYCSVQEHISQIWCKSTPYLLTLKYLFLFVVLK